MKYYIAYKFIIPFYLLLICILLVSCKNKQLNCLRNSYAIDKWEQHQTLVSKIMHYQSYCVLSRFSSKNKQDIRVRFFFQKLNYKKFAYRLVLMNPFGFTFIELMIHDDMTCLIKNKKKYYYSTNDIEKIIKQSMNMNISLHDLSYWIIGLPGNNNNFIISTDGYLKEINYHDHNKTLIILYNSYYRYSQPVLPSNIDIYCDNDIHYNLKIHKWIVS